MKKLFEISNEYLNIFDQIEENNGELSAEIEKKLAISESELKQKGIAYCAVIKKLDGELETIDKEINRLQALKKTRNNIVQNLKDRLKYALLQFDITEIKTELIKINFRKSKNVVIDNIEDLPEFCKKVKVAVTADKKLIKEMIESGKMIKGAHIEENKNLQIK